MVLQLIGAPTSWNSLRARHVLFENGLHDAQLIYLSLKDGDQKRPDHLTKHPYGKVPVLIDGDVTVFESRAIARYVAIKYRDSAESLVPDLTDFEGVGLFEEAASAELAYFDRIAEPLVTKHVIAKFNRVSVSQDEVSILLTELTPRLDVLDGTLSGRTYMVGEKFSLVDAFYMPLIHLIVNLGLQDLVFARQHLKRWWETVIQREAWGKAVEPFNEVYGF
ncbi:Glutathione S-transferase F12 [Cladobotryum mycophilum]|uniref:glutathione transferase n=1 Tax=Cladobotryum mycophilum TaxID=491253 RepID=A0ABR0SSE3_9HYPO